MREQPDFSTHPRPRRPPAAEVALVLAAVLALGAASRSAWVARREATAARDRVSVARREVASLESRVQATSGRSAAEARLLVRAAAAAESPPQRIVAVLGRAFPEAARLQALTIDYGEAVSLEMQVVARDTEAWDLLLARLHEDSSFEDVTPGPERRDGEIRSSISARWAGGVR